MGCRRTDWRRALAWLLVATGSPCACWAQAPTIEGSGTFQTATGNTTPGSTQSLLGRTPGTIGGRLGIQPGSDEMFFGRAGPSAPRVPTSIFTPGGVYQGPPQTQGVLAPQPLPAPRPPFYGTLEITQGGGGGRGAARWADSRPGDRSFAPRKPRPAREAIRDPAVPRRCLDCQSARQPDFLLRRPTRPLWLRFGSQARWAHPIRCEHIATDRLCPQRQARMALASLAP